MLFDGGWLAHFASTSLPHQARTSLSVALEAAVVAFAVGAVPAVAVSRFEFRGRRLVSVLALLPLLFAPLRHGRHLDGDVLVGVLREPARAGHPARADLRALRVHRLPGGRRAHPERVRRTGGRAGPRPLAALLRVHLPAYAVPAAAGLMIVFAQAIGDYAAAERLGIDTLSVGMHNLWLASQSSSVAAIVSVVMIVPSVLLVGVAAWASTSIISQNPMPPGVGRGMSQAAGQARGLGLLAWSMLCSLPALLDPRGAHGALGLAQVGAYALCRHSRRHAQRGRHVAGHHAGGGGGVRADGAAAALGRALAPGRARALAVPEQLLPALAGAGAGLRDDEPRRLAGRAGWLGSMRDSRLLIVVSEALRFMPFAMLPVLDALRRTPMATIEAARAFGAGPLARAKGGLCRASVAGAAAGLRAGVHGVAQGTGHEPDAAAVRLLRRRR